MSSWNATHNHEQKSEDKYYWRSNFDSQTVIQTLIRFRIMKVLENVTLNDAFTSPIRKLRIGPSATFVGSVIANPNILISETLSQLHLESYLLCLYLKDVSSLLAMIRSLDYVILRCIQNPKKHCCYSFLPLFSKIAVVI